MKRTSECVKCGKILTKGNRIRLYYRVGRMTNPEIIDGLLCFDCYLKVHRYIHQQETPQPIDKEE